MKKNYLLLILATTTCMHMEVAAQTTSRTTTYRYTAIKKKPAQNAVQKQGNWLLNLGVGYGGYYGDMSNYRIRSFSDIGLLRNFVNFNKNYIPEPSFHLSGVKRLGNGSTGIGFNFNRTLIQGSDRYVNTAGVLQLNNRNFARSLNFRTDILDAGISINLNAFSKGIITPYLNLGTGISFFNVKGDVFTGTDQNQVYNYASTQNVNDGIFETNLRDARTETDETYANKAIYAQGVLGINFRLGASFSLAAEADVKYSGSDFLDDLSGTYKPSYPNLRSEYIARPGYNGINPATRQRGDNDKMNDFYIQTRVVLRFHLPKYLKRSEIKRQQEKFNAPVLYPSSYPINTLDSSAYIRAQNRLMYGNPNGVVNKDSIAKKKMMDSLMLVAKTDSVKADSLAKARTVNVKMDSAYVNELKALRQEIANLRTTISSGIPAKKDSVVIRRMLLKDSLSQSQQKLQQKKKKTAADSLQLQIYQLRLDSIGVAEKLARRDSLAATNTSAAPIVNTQPAQVSANNGSVAVVPATFYQEDSLRRVIDSLRLINEYNANRSQTRGNNQVNTQQPVRTQQNSRDTLNNQSVQQYQRQISGLAYRNRQAGVSDELAQRRQDSIKALTNTILASDSLQINTLQARAELARQQEAELKATAPRGLLVKKSDAVKQAEQQRKDAEAALQAAQNSQRTNLQNVRVAAGDTTYITSLQQQVNTRQAEIDQLKNNKKITDVFSNKNRQIKELEEQQEAQKRELEEANRMLQYYRSTGPTSYVQPQYYPQQQQYYQQDYRKQFDDFNDRLNDLQKQRFALALAQQAIPVNRASPVVVSTNTDNDDERKRMQAEIDSLRSQVTALNNTRTDSITRTNSGFRADSVARAKPVYDSTLYRSMAAADSTQAQMALIQKQLAELSGRMSTTKQATPTTNGATTTSPALGTTVYFTSGSAVLAALQKSKLAAMVRKAKPNNEYVLTASSDNTTGNTDANEALARRRAAAVETYLKALKVPAANISTEVNISSYEPGAKPDPLAKKVDVKIM